MAKLSFVCIGQSLNRKKNLVQRYTPLLVLPCRKNWTLSITKHYEFAQVLFRTSPVEYRMVKTGSPPLDIQVGENVYATC